MKKDLAKHLFSILIVAIFGLLTIGSMDTEEDTKKVKAQSPRYTLSADSLYQAYEDNEVAADAKYKGKIVVVSGTIQSIGKDIMDQAYVVIGGKGFLDGVQCTFTKGQDSSVARLKKGQTVQIKGEVSGRIVGNVLINKCTLQ